MYDSGKRDDSFTGEVGKALHVGYQNYLTYNDEELATFEMMLKYPVNFLNAPSYAKEQRSLAACYATLQKLMKSKVTERFELVQVKLANDEIVPAIEVPFEIILKNVFLDVNNQAIPISYIGFIDLVIWNIEEQQFQVVDIKSHRRQMEDLTPLYQWDEQCLPYGLILQHVTGQQINSFIVTYLAAYTDVLEPRVIKYDFNKSQNDVNDWAHGLMVDIKKLQEFYRLGWFPRDGASSEACLSWNRKCAFFDNVCGTRNQAAVKDYLLDGEEPGEYPFEPWITMELEIAA